MKKKTLAELALPYIIEVIITCSRVFKREGDFQNAIVECLKATNLFDEVEAEFGLPTKYLVNFPWSGTDNSEIKIDIRIRKGNEDALIELKYKTKEVRRDTYKSGKLIKDYPILKNDDAQGTGRYDFWKDIKRIEAAVESTEYPDIKSGLAIFLTNDFTYTKSTKITTNCHNFDMNEGKHDTNKHWLVEKDNTTHKGRPNFDLSNEYDIHWNDIDIDNVPFKYCIVTI